MHPLTRIIGAMAVAFSSPTLLAADWDEPEAELESTRAEVAQAGSAFAIDLYHRLREDEGNVLFSPLSVSAALSMAQAGARADTSREMASVLRLPSGEADEVHPAIGYLLTSIGDTAEIANRAWAQEDVTILDSYQDLLEASYKASMERADFSDTQAAAARINGWVEDKTDGRITDLIAPDLLARASLVLTNAIAFKGKWASPFDPERTNEEPFTLATGEERSVKMMHQDAEFGYFADDDAQGLEMAFDEGDLSLVILMPSVGSLGAFEAGLTADRLGSWLDQFEERRVVASVPRLSLTAEFALDEVLESMGMTSAFTPAADFSGITGQRNLFITAVQHKAFFEMDEEGAEAAAATGVVLSRAMPPTFRADRPFIVLIRDRVTDAILFLGRVVDPEGDG